MLTTLFLGHKWWCKFEKNSTVTSWKLSRWQVGEARHGLEQVRRIQMSEALWTNRYMGVYSTSFSTSSTYRGGKSKSFSDTRIVPLSHTRTIETYRAMPALAPKLQVSNASKFVDRVPVMFFSCTSIRAWQVRHFQMGQWWSSQGHEWCHKHVAQRFCFVL